jgi:hypothetical protein
MNAVRIFDTKTHLSFNGIILTKKIIFRELMLHTLLSWNGLFLNKKAVVAVEVA